MLKQYKNSLRKKMMKQSKNVYILIIFMQLYSYLYFWLLSFNAVEYGNK